MILAPALPLPPLILLAPPSHSDRTESMYLDSFDGNQTYLTFPSSSSSGMSSSSSSSSSGMMSLENDNRYHYKTTPDKNNYNFVTESTSHHHPNRYTPIHTPYPDTIESTLLSSGIPILVPSSIHKRKRLDAGFFGQVRVRPPYLNQSSFPDFSL